MKTKILEKRDLSGKIAVVVGTRPGIIKFSPVIRELKNRKADFFIIHTGQHYSYNMDKAFFDNLELPEPLFTNDKIRENSTHGGQTAEMIKGVEAACLEARPSIVIVGGDANTNFAAAVAVRKLVSIILVHMEAGLRSHDWRMPEEHNRVMIDHISDILLLPTKQTGKNLEKENIKGEMFYTGNTIVDAVYQNLELARKKSTILQTIGNDPFILLTLHREENVDSKEIMESIIKALSMVQSKFKLKTVFPCHPRTIIRLEQFGLQESLKKIPGLIITEPVDYLDFLMLMNNAQVVLTDSGGIQEETCILKVPCVTIRENTERPETVEVGSNIIAGTSPQKICEATEKMITVVKEWGNPFGDGEAAKRIVDTLEKYAAKNRR